MNLTKYGVWVGRTIDEGDLPRAAQLAEQLGFGVFWLGGSPRLTTLGPILEATSKITIATGIVNVWAYEPSTLAAEFHELDQQYPDRLLLGLGIGHPEVTSEYTGPLTKMTSFLDGLAAATHPVPKDQMVIAALGPKMLDLSAERTLGTHPYFSTPEHTRFAREHLGSGVLIAPEISVVLDQNHETAIAAARKYAQMYLERSNYTNNLKRFGFEDADFTDGGSERLMDVVVPQGPPPVIAQAVQRHLDAGADHVAVQTVGVRGVPEAQWRAVASVLMK